jgi:hypothetical protein
MSAEMLSGDVNFAEALQRCPFLQSLGEEVLADIRQDYEASLAAMETTPKSDVQEIPESQRSPAPSVEQKQVFHTSEPLEIRNVEAITQEVPRLATVLQEEVPIVPVERVIIEQEQQIRVHKENEVAQKSQPVEKTEPVRPEHPVEAMKASPKPVKKPTVAPEMKVVDTKAKNREVNVEVETAPKPISIEKPQPQPETVKKVVTELEVPALVKPALEAVEAKIEDCIPVEAEVPNFAEAAEAAVMTDDELEITESASEATVQAGVVETGGEAQIVVATESVEPVKQAISEVAQPVVEAFKETIQDIAPLVEQPAVIAVVEQIQEAIENELVELQKVIVAEIADEVVLNKERITALKEVELSPKLEKLVEELTQLLGDVEPEEVRKLVMQLRQEIIEQVAEEVEEWIDDGMHEALRMLQPKKHDIRDLLHSLLGRLAVYRQPSVALD